MTSLADAKARLSELVATVAVAWERVVITKNGRPVAVLMSVEDLEALVETLEVLSDPEAMASIRASDQPDAEWATGEETAAIMAKRSGRGAGVTYSLRLSRFARRSLERDLPEAVASAVWEFISGDLQVNPHCVGTALRFDLEGYRSARRGMYRVVYRIADAYV